MPGTTAATTTPARARARLGGRLHQQADVAQPWLTAVLGAVIVVGSIGGRKIGITAAELEAQVKAAHPSR